MDERERQIVETQRAEAIALFQANQAGRAAAAQVGALLLTVIGVAAGAGISAHTDAVALIVPPIALLLLSYMFQQYAEVAVTGAARAALERQLADELGAHALIYEYAVAGVRQRTRLAKSVRLLQVMTGLLLLAIVGSGVYVAFESQPWYVDAGFAVGTLVGLASAALSYRDMLGSARLASLEIERALGLASSSPQRKPLAPSSWRGDPGPDAARERVFISYTRPDARTAATIAARLELSGFSVWLDQVAIEPGERVERAVQRGLDSADAFVVVVGASPSPWVRREWSVLVERLWRDPDLAVIPVLVGDADPPAFLRGVRYVRLKPDDPHAVDAIATQLRNRPVVVQADIENARRDRARRLDAIRAAARQASRHDA